MPTIVLETKIRADIDICFDLSRSIDLHKISMTNSDEKAIAGKTTGLIDLGEFVTWEATHFGIKQKLTSRITAYDRPLHFRDEQVKGAFKLMVHDHKFKSEGDAVVMTDIFSFESPLGIFGELFNQLILTNYMRRLLVARNEVIKEFAETEKWKLVLSTN